ncbi:hypothetical protein ACWEP4_37010 [Streptomyces sp. NPDC004227]
MRPRPRRKALAAAAGAADLLARLSDRWQGTLVVGQPAKETMGEVRLGEDPAEPPCPERLKRVS